MVQKAKIKSEIEVAKSAVKKAKISSKSSKEKEFLISFMKQLMLAKEKQQAEEKKETRKVKKGEKTIEKRIVMVEKKLRPSVMRRKKMRQKLKPLTIEEEKIEKPREKIERVEIAPKPTPEAMEEAPIYKRPLPTLLKPEIRKDWPLPPPRPPARPPEEEAMAPPTEEMPYPEAPVYPAPAPPEKPKEKSIALVTLDLGKLNIFIKDKTISVIQCDGANIPIKITKEIVKETKIKLTEDEIREIVQKFADRAEQPLTEPIFKTKINNLSITAIISAFAGSKFVISRIS